MLWKFSTHFTEKRLGTNCEVQNGSIVVWQDFAARGGGRQAMGIKKQVDFHNYCSHKIGVCVFGSRGWCS